MRFLLFLVFLLSAPPAFAHDVHRTLPGEPCTVPPLPNWSAGETWAWREICAGRIADMSRFSGDDAGCTAWVKEGDPTPWPPERTLRADFIQTIATRHPFTEAPSRPAVLIRCAMVEGFLDFTNETVPQTLWIDDSRLADGLSLYDTRVSRGLSFDGSEILGGSVRASGLRIDGAWFLRRARLPEFSLVGAKITGDVGAVGSTFTGRFDADRMDVGGSLFLQDGATFEEGVDLLDAKIAGSVVAVGSTFSGLFNADRMDVGGSLFLRGGAAFEGGVDLLGAKIAGNVEAIGSTFAGPFNADGMEVGGSLFLRNGSLFMAGLALHEVSVGRDAQLQGTVFNGKVDFTDATIEGTLVLGRGETNPTWGADAVLVLRDARAGALQANMPDADVPQAIHSWQRTMSDGLTSALPIDLAFFRYDRFDESSFSGLDISEINVDRLLAWLEGAWMSGGPLNAEYLHGQYRQLSQALRASGAEAAANEVDYASLLHRMRNRENLVQRALDWLSRVLFGFGIYPLRTLYWFLALVAAGWLVTRWSPELKHKSSLHRLFYSLENAIPLIDLSQGFQDIRHDDAPHVASFFHFQKIAGFGLATVLVGALTVLGG